MAEIIASTYELLDKIGSGGGGIVYLARHMRLDKTVVLKADKRSVTTKPEALRREVDAMKNLSHTYIPQVYDFIIENDTVYTVMDYVEGESLDKPLKRGVIFPQAQIIEWACQLLDALIYLHSRPPHGILHSDIKPANIMLTPQNDIRLIDFNIALALGDEGTVRVGLSRGYASPEHYGLDYSTSSDTARDISTVPLDGTTSNVSTGSHRPTRSTGSNSAGTRRRTMFLDVRSDIYSLGATLYHLLTGIRPDPDALKVLPISSDNISPAVSAIIAKAMNPNPDLRYQTAAEMLDAFEHLYTNDPRSRGYRKRRTVTAVSLAAVFLIGGVCSFFGLRQMQREDRRQREIAEAAEEQERLEREKAEAAEEVARQNEENERLAKEAEEAAKTALEAIGNSQTAYASGDTDTAVSEAMRALELDTSYNAQAQKALTDALGVYDMSDGFKSSGQITLPSEPTRIALSPGGTRIAAMCGGTMVVYDTSSREPVAELASENTALARVVFAGEDVLYYAGDGAIRAYDLNAGKELWSGLPATNISLSADGTTVAAVYRDETFATVYDAATGAVRVTVDFHGQKQTVSRSDDQLFDTGGYIFSLNRDGTKLAVSFDGGAFWSFDLIDSDEDIIIFETSDYVRFTGGFNGDYLAYAAVDANYASRFGIVNPSTMSSVAATNSEDQCTAFADETGIYVAETYFITKVNADTRVSSQMAYTDGDINAFFSNGAYTAASTKNGALYFFGAAGGQLARFEDGSIYDEVAIAGEYAAASSVYTKNLRLFKLQTKSDKEIFSYDPTYSHTEARISAAGDTVMLFDVYEFRLCAMDGTVIADVELPDPEEIYDQQFRRISSGTDGSYLEVIYTDGLVRKYSATDGRLMSEERGEAPASAIVDEYLTDNWRIVSPLTGTVEIYDRYTDEFIRTWDTDDYLTYVTQVDDYVIMEYTTATAGRYGILLNDSGETLAELVNLCDILEDGTLIFDDTQGSLRESALYSLDNLKSLASE